MFYEYFSALRAFLTIENPVLLLVAISVFGALSVMWRRRTRALAEAEASHRLRAHLDWTKPHHRSRR